MRRRELIILLGGMMAAARGLRAQQKAMPVIGFINSKWPRTEAKRASAFRAGLKETGYVEGQNVAIEYRWAEGRYERLPALAADLARRPVDLIVATGGTLTVLAAKAATATIPIVFTLGSDPVESGVVASLSRPAGNLTGVSFLAVALGAKRLELLHELVPAAKAVAMLVNPDSPATEIQLKDAEAAARAIGQQIHILNARSERDFDAAFATLAERRSNGLIIAVDALMDGWIDRLVALAARYGVPTVHYLREFVEAGGLMCYGASITDAYRQAGIYAGRILKGAKPGDLPIVQPTKFELVVNLKTAKTLGIAVPQALLASADEVIE